MARPLARAPDLTGTSPLTQEPPPAASRASPPAEAARLSLLGHDLRAAMSDIVGGLRLIDQSALPPDTRLQMGRVRTAAEALARLLEEGLSLLPGEDGTPAGSVTIVPLARMLYDIELRWTARAQERGLALRVVTQGPLPASIAIDQLALERLLSNLLSNAIKYTPAGLVVLSFCIDAADALIIEVTDDGPGFSQPVLDQLFTYQARPVEGARHGTGLGLFISREMAERLRGTLTITNRPEGGGCARLTLPRTAWEPGPQAAQEPAPLPRFDGLHVLLAEDSATTQMIAARMLESLGATVTTASDGAEALALLRERAFGLAIIDIEMPELSGLEVIGALRALPGGRGRMPVIAATAYVLRANREAILSAGADRILPKPLPGIEIFAHALADVLGTGTPDATTPPVELDRARLDQLLAVAGPEGRRELLRRLRADLGEVERGLIAGLAAHDPALVRRHSHVLIAVAGAVGADRLRHAAEELNTIVHGPLPVTWDGGQVLDLLDRLLHVLAGETRRYEEI